MAQSFPIIGISEDTKYDIADSIVKHCNNLSPDIVTNNSKFYFREIINSDIIINKTRISLAQAFDEETAMHITNLVLKRLQSPALVRTVASVDIVSE